MATTVAGIMDGTVDGVAIVGADPASHSGSERHTLTRAAGILAGCGGMAVGISVAFGFADVTC
jgi:hypothetical protein